MKPPVVLWLKNTGRQQLEQVGGKCAHLGELARLDMLIPDGFCVPSDVYRTCIHQAPAVWAPIRQEMSRIDFESMESLRIHSRRIREIISGAEIPAEISAAILAAYQELTGSTQSAACAVRSSATSEDGQEASSAGQQDTFLGVSGSQNLLQKIKDCWASLWNERAMAYRRDQGTGDQPVRIAVLVQSMLAAQVAGVLFTRDPLTGADQTLINASWGLGEMVVSGRVVPDECVLRFQNQTPQEISYRVGSKEFALWEAGQPPAALPPEQSSARCLPPGAALELARLGQQIEQYFGTPQDIEWALAEDRLYILQSRPITTLPTGLSPLFHETHEDDSSLWTSAFLIERFPGPVSPLGWSVFFPLIETVALREPLRFVGFRDSAALKIFRMYQGHTYVNVRVYQILYKYFPDALLPADARRFFPEGDVALRKTPKQPDFYRFLLSAAHTLLSTPDWTPWHYRKWERFAREFDLEQDEMNRAIAQNGGAIAGLLAILPQIDARVAGLLRIHRWSLTYADGLMAVLKGLIAAWTHPRGLDEVTSHLVAGLTNQTTQIDTELWSLSQSARKIKNWKQYLVSGTNPTGTGGPAERRDDPAGLELGSQFQAFVKKFDYRSISLDIFYPSFGDDPGQVARLLSLLSETETEGPLAKIERQRQRREAETKALRDTLRRGWFRSVFPVRWITLKVLLHFLHIYLRLREDQRFYLQKGLHAYRKVFLQIGRLLFPAEPEGIFFLTRAEIEGATRQEAPLSGLRDKIDERKHEFSRIQHSGCPPFLQGNAPYVSNQERQPGAGQAALRGIPVSAGKRTGRARIIAGPADLQSKARFIEPGDILVTKSTDPAWTPILLKLGGLVMETGGLLSHGAVIAREYGIPAVVGVPDAVQALREGELLEVDGSTGWVTRLG